MKGIILTDDQVIKMHELIEEFFSNSFYGSYDNFKARELSEIKTFPLKDGLNRLSHTVLDDPIYTDLKEFVLDNMDAKLIIRDIDPSELPESEEI